MNACTTYALAYLQRYHKSEHELRQKLQQKWFAQDDINEAIEFLKNNKYLDDYTYASLYLSSEVGRKGKPLLIIQGKLRQRGIDKETITAATDDQEEELYQGMRNKVERLVHQLGTSPQAQQKIVNRGYPLVLVKRVMSENEQ